MKHPGIFEASCPKEDKLQRGKKSKTKQTKKEQQKKDYLNANTISLVLNTSIILSDERLNTQVFSI